MSEVSDILVSSVLQRKIKSPPKVFIAIPHYQGTMRVELSKFLQIQTLQSSLNHFPFFESRPWDATRNLIVKDFLETRRNYNFLLMIDTDVVPPANILDLANFNCDIISPVCFSFQEGAPFALILKEVPGGFQQLNPVPANQLIEDVGACGTGCLMIHRRVLEALDPPWFRFEYTKEGLLGGGEDFFFMKKARAAGFKIFVHTSYLASHYSEIDLLQVNNLLGKVQQESAVAACKEVLQKVLVLLNSGESIEKIKQAVENSLQGQPQKKN